MLYNTTFEHLSYVRLRHRTHTKTALVSYRRELLCLRPNFDSRVDRYSYRCHNVQTGSVVHTAFGDKRPGCETNHSSPFSAEFKNAGSCASTVENLRGLVRAGTGKVSMM
jgi:hypothetical protein